MLAVNVFVVELVLYSKARSTAPSHTIAPVAEKYLAHKLML
jgi:hypothetical protein